MEDGRRGSHVIGPDGERLTKADLPSPGVRRWVPRRKARVVAAVEGGQISQEEACARYSLSAEELDDWKAGLTRYGLRGLCVTRINERRETSE